MSDRVQKSKKKRQGRLRSVPQRTCVSCRTVLPKRELVRVVRMPDHTIAVDPSGKTSGRGAYLCRQKSCWNNALKRGSLDRALKIGLDATTKAMLSAYAEALPQNSSIVPNNRGEGHGR